jgi:hypothetical protein
LPSINFWQVGVDGWSRRVIQGFRLQRTQDMRSSARTAGLVQAGFARILRAVGFPAFIAAVPRKLDPLSSLAPGASQLDAAQTA